MTEEELEWESGAGVARTHLDGVSGEGEDIQTKTLRGRRSRFQSIGEEVVCQMEQLVWFSSVTTAYSGQLP